MSRVNHKHNHSPKTGTAGEAGSSSVSERDVNVKSGGQNPEWIDLNSWPSPVIIYGGQKEIIFVNQAFCQLSGFSRGELEGQKPAYPFWKGPLTGKLSTLYFKPDKKARTWLIQNKGGRDIWIESVNYSVPGKAKTRGIVSQVREVNAEKKTKEDLAKTRKKWQKVFDTIPLPLAIMSFPESRFIDVNKAFVKTAGYQRKDFIGKPAMQLSWQDGQSRDTVDRAVRNKRRVSDVEIRLLSKDGKPHVALMSARVVKLKDEEFTVSVSTDITLRKQAEEALRRSEAFNASLLRDAPNPILVCNSDTSIRFVNPAFCHFTGFSEQELLGQLPPYPWWPAGRNEEYNRENQRSSIIESDNIERLIIKKNGDPAWINISIRHVKENHQKKYFIAIWTDITEGKRSAQALHESQIFNARILNDAPNPILVIESDGAIKYANPALEQITGFSSHEYLGMKLPHPWCPPEQVNQYLKGIRESADSNMFFEEQLLRKKNGQYFWVTIKVRRIGDPGSSQLYLANWVDVTERKKMEESLNSLYQKEKLQREELEEEARLRGHFINVLAHELRTPITPILSSTDILKSLYTSKRDSVQKKLAENIFASANTLAQRLEELLVMARHARGAFKLNIQPVELSPYLNAVVERFKPALKQWGQKLIADIPDNLPNANLDASRLEQVLINLLSNASKFSHEKAQIELTVRAVDSDLLVDVKDHGIGIPHESQERLFQPYYRVEQDRQQVPGLGLGLAVSKQIIEAHGGKIWVVSDKGKGSTFSFRIPLSPAE